MPALAMAFDIPGATLARSFLKHRAPEHKVLELKPSMLAEWTHPAFQRPLSLNEDVKQLARTMQREAAQDPDGMCMIPDTVAFGRLNGKDYLVDGQHRIHGAFAIAAGLRRLENCDAILEPGIGALAKCALVDAKITTYDSMADMAEAFAQAQKKLVTLKPDDLLRAREETNPHLRALREACPFIGYTKNRDTKETIMLSMSVAVRTWFGSGMTPTPGPQADAAQRMLDEQEEHNLIAFFQAAEGAGWVSPLFPRLWATLNLGINMWLWRKTVLGTANKYKGGTSSMVLTPDEYSQCMAELRKSAEYQAELATKALRFQDRYPTYDLIKELFNVALARMGKVGPRFPQPQGWDR